MQNYSHFYRESPQKWPPGINPDFIRHCSEASFIKGGRAAKQKQCKSALLQQSSATAAYTMLIFTPIIGRKLPCTECAHTAQETHTNYTLNYT